MRLKIGLPKLRLSRKLLLITLGITVLLGGTGATALYFGGEGLTLEGGENAVGGECTDIQTMVIKTPSNHLWLRKFIRMENASGPDRVRTALRIAGLLAKKNTVDLIHVSVLDSHGPTIRSHMRARSIGAEVLIALKPDNLPEMKSPAMASYYEGPASDTGRYYGDKVVVDISEIGAMMTAMRTVEEKPDCATTTPAPDDAEKKNDHGKKDKKESHEAKPADHGEKPAEDHGEEPAKDGAAEAAHAEQPAKEESFLDSMLSMVGLGGSEEKPAADHPPATDDSNAVAEEPVEDHGEKAPNTHDAQPSEDAQSTTEGHDPAPEPKQDEAAKPADAATDAHGDKPDENAAKPDDHGETPAAEGHDAAATETDHEPAKTPVDATAEEHAQPSDATTVDANDPASEPEHDAAAETSEEHAVEPEDHADKPAAEGHDAAATETSHEPAGTPVDAAADDHAQPSHTDAEEPSQAKDHGNEEKPLADKHARVDMPVGD